MAYVEIPKDLSSVKRKIALNMTKRQLIINGIGTVLGSIVFFSSYNIIGVTPAMYIMFAIMAPCFFLSLYEKNGQTLEEIILIRIRFNKSKKVRKYKFKNWYERILEYKKN